MSFIESQLDPLIGYGTKGGLSYVSTVVGTPSRIETRFALQSRGYWNLNITFKDKSKKQMMAIQAHHSLVQGKVYGFRIRNYREYYTCTDDFVGGQATMVAEPISTFVGGLTLQLMHTRRVGTATQEIVPIKKPDLSVPIILYRDGSGTPYSAANYAVNLTTGVVTFTSDQTGHTFAWKGYWDTPVRYDVDAADIEHADFDVFNWDGIVVREIQLP